MNSRVSCFGVSRYYIKWSLGLGDVGVWKEGGVVLFFWFFGRVMNRGYIRRKCN